MSKGSENDIFVKQRSKRRRWAGHTERRENGDSWMVGRERAESDGETGREREEVDQGM